MATLTKASKVQKIPKKAKVNNGGGKMKRFLSKVSGAFMLPISVMAIAGLFLGVGTIMVKQGDAHSIAGLKLAGQFISDLGNPVFTAMPLLFAAAIAVAFTEEAGIAVFSAIIGYMAFNMLQTAFITPIYEGDLVKTALNNKSLESGAIFGKNHQLLSGWKILFSGTARAPKEMLKLVGSNLGVNSLQTSVFGGIVCGSVSAYAYNHYHTIKLPNMISFFGGKRFVALATLIFIVPITFAFLAVWPYIGYGLAKFGQLSGQAKWGTDSLAFGFIERALIPFGLHHVFYAPLWWTPAGGDLGTTLTSAATKAGLDGSSAKAAADALFETNSATAVKNILDSGKSGDSFLWIEFSKINNLILKADVFKNHGEKLGIGNASLPTFKMLSALGLNLGRFMQGKFPFMTMALPAAAMAMVFAAPKGNRKMAFGAIFPAALTSFTTGVTEPIEFTFLFLAPWLFWGFHAIMAGVSFMLMNLLGAHIGMTFSGGIIDMVIYGILPMKAGTSFWWAFVIGAGMAPLYFFVFYFSIKIFNLETPGRGSNTQLFTKADFKAKKSNKGTSENPQAKAIVAAYGGWSNITGTANCATRLRFDVKDSTKVDEKALKACGAAGVMRTSKNHVQAIFGPQAEQLHVSIKALPKNATKKATAKKVVTKKVTNKKVASKKPAAKKAVTKKPTTKKATTKKATTKKATTKKAATKKATAKKAVTKKVKVKKTQNKK